MIALIDVREKAAAALAPVADSDPNVLVSLVDSIEPPALMLGWGEPWLEPEGNCFAMARLIVTAVSARLMPGEGIATLEQLVSYTMSRLQADSPDWNMESVTGPRIFLIGKTNYLASRISIKLLVNI